MMGSGRRVARMSGRDGGGEVGAGKQDGCR